MSNDSLKITTREKDNIRTMYINGEGQSAIDLRDPQNYVFEYMKYFFFPFLLTEIKSALFIGGGGFTGPRIFASQGVEVDAVEINEEVIRVAKEQFAADAFHFNIIIDDGLEYLTNCRKKYDVIIVDAFVVNKTPLHLQSLDFFKLAAKHLAPSGVFLSNNITAPGASLFNSLCTNLSQVFGSLYAFDVDPPSVQSKNIMLVATNAPALTMSELQKRNTVYSESTNKRIDFETELDENLVAYDAPIVQNDYIR